MKFLVQRPFHSGDRQLQRGEFVDLTPSLRTQKMVESRYLIPADAEVASATATSDNAAINAVVTRRSKKD
jgi:hypothetical protein